MSLPSPSALKWSSTAQYKLNKLKLVHFMVIFIPLSSRHQQLMCRLKNGLNWCQPRMIHWSSIKQFCIRHATKMRVRFVRQSWAQTRAGACLRFCLSTSDLRALFFILNPLFLSLHPNISFCTFQLSCDCPASIAAVTGDNKVNWVHFERPVQTNLGVIQTKLGHSRTRCG